MVGHRTQDYWGRPLQDLRISVMDRCSFRCPYCMPESLYPEEFRFLSGQERLSFDEIVQIARVAVQLGVRKLRLTGGEPLLRADLPELITRLASLEGVEDLALTTNGVLLPRQALALRQAGLHRVTVSLDALDPTTFEQMSGGRGRVEQVLEGIEAARRVNFPKGIKINTVVQRGVNEKDVRPLALYGRQRGIVVRFIEYMDVGTRNGWQISDVVRAEDILALLSEDGELERLPSYEQHDVAQRYRYRHDGSEIGVIASVTSPFCRGCSRARLSSDGKLHTCLFSAEGFDLRSLLRGQDMFSLEEVMRSIWQERRDRYSDRRFHQHDKLSSGSRVEMNYIGG
ncbi:GTP 3',8-cyclase MoaA [Saccharibacter sp. 17.LH.SD]|uniref:GTP 3',8-cyclase MoaA n=1 Tax=Saccharibacter sp. 17.LH.SD TaxID=2689393 RepID=UPI00136BBF3D|nr:GTP 3',8-cyclase MoaA [Saccharibacter sp. 17.LH.SD]MXV43772.1 GTP 3',8-cyclase MoaA [Saccharibacter sp. 17.LH.SD]